MCKQRCCTQARAHVREVNRAQSKEQTQHNTAQHSTRQQQDNDRTGQDRKRQERRGQDRRLLLHLTFKCHQLHRRWSVAPSPIPSTPYSRTSRSNQLLAQRTMAGKIMFGSADVSRTKGGKLIIGPADQKRTFN